MKCIQKSSDESTYRGSRVKSRVLNCPYYLILFRFSMLSDSTFVHLLSYLSQDIEGVIGVFLTQNQRLQVVSYGIFHRCAKKNIVAFKVDLILPRVVELCLDFILVIVREGFVVKHIYIYIKKCFMRNQDYS